MRKKNLLIITTTFPSRKDDIVTARFVFDLARTLTAHYNVHVLAPASPGAKGSECMDDVKVHRFRYFFPASLQLLTTGDGILANLKKNMFLTLQLPFLLISELASAAFVIKKEKIDVVNSHWIIPQGLIIAMLKKPLSVKHILTIHAADIFALKRWGRIGSMLARYIIKRSDKVVAVSNYIKSTIDELVCTDYNVMVMPMGVRLELFNGKESAEAYLTTGKSDTVLKILFVGKMVEKKGLKFLLEALHAIKKKNRPFRLDVVGGGLLEAELKLHASMLGIGQDVHFYGWVANEKLPDFYKKCDIVAVPSVFDRKGETEGMPVVILEAMAMSKPVLASSISGIPDLVVDGYNGWLTAPGDVEQIIDKLEAVYDSDIPRYGYDSYKTAEKFSYEKVATVYKEAIG